MFTTLDTHTISASKSKVRLSIVNGRLFDVSRRTPDINWRFFAPRSRAHHGFVRIADETRPSVDILRRWTRRTMPDAVISCVLQICAIYHLELRRSKLQQVGLKSDQSVQVGSQSAQVALIGHYTGLRKPHIFVFPGE